MKSVCNVGKFPATIYCKYQGRSEVVAKAKSDAKFNSYLIISLLKHI